MYYQTTRQLEETIEATPYDIRIYCLVVGTTIPILTYYLDKTERNMGVLEYFHEKDKRVLN